MPHAVAAKGFNRLAEIALRNLAELLTDTIQRFYQYRHQVAVGEQQDQQTHDRGGDNHRPGHTGEAVDHHARAVERLRRGVVKVLSR